MNEFSNTIKDSGLLKTQYGVTTPVAEALRRKRLRRAEDSGIELTEEEANAAGRREKSSNQES